MIEIISGRIIPVDEEMGSPETLTVLVKVNGRYWSIGGLNSSLSKAEVQQVLDAKEPEILADIAKDTNGEIIEVFNAQKDAYKLSPLYGLTHPQLDTYIDSLSSGADYKEAFRRALHAILWLVKQTRLDE